MTTVINTPSNTDSGESGAGWAVAVLILLVVMGAGVYFWLHYRGTAPAASGGTNINVTLPQNPVTNPAPTS
jgi:heme/copper-type cytochrome/quinol oxidase subunit 2